MSQLVILPLAAPRGHDWQKRIGLAIVPDVEVQIINQASRLPREGILRARQVPVSQVLEIAFNITNTLCPAGGCIPKSGIPVALINGASAGNVFIGPNPIKSLGAGSLTTVLSNPTLAAGGTASIVVSGPSSKVTITAP